MICLSERFKNRAVAPIFGSYTWPPFRAQAGTLNRSYRAYRDHIDFFTVYIKEIHSTDGWQVDENVEDGVLVAQHQSFEERVEVGRTCMIKPALETHALVDEMNERVAAAYAAMPERFYWIGRGGKIVYPGGMGPMFFRPAEWEEAIMAYLSGELGGVRV